MHRRDFLKDAGAIGMLCTGGCWFAYERGVLRREDVSPYQPWQDWRLADGGSPLALVRAAILAASPHNTQPWRFRVDRSSIELHIDKRRNVGALDPYLREEYIGMGCALENLMLAAPANGFAAVSSLVSGPISSNASNLPTELVARVELVSGTRSETDLYQAIPQRHTNRSVYDSHRPLPADFLEALRRLPAADEAVNIFLFSDEAERNRIVELSSDANNEIYSDPQVEAASERWIRLKRDEVKATRDGLTVDTFGLSPFATALAKRMPASLLSRLVSRGQMHGYAERMLSAPLIGFIAVRDRYDRAQCLQAGRIWQRAHLFATARGIAARPSNEASERVDHERMAAKPDLTLKRLSLIAGDPGWQPTFIFLMGYPTLDAHASPRRPVQQVLDA